jgi:NADH-quinone oxidoreductase subunit G/[NiFe] hydrogenase diaphorase moiety small subunit/NADP-reducing hydrogenase subunit HndD
MISRHISRKGGILLRQMASEMVKLKVDGKDVTVPKGTLLVEAVKIAGSTVPTMCYHPDVPGTGGLCRICLVENVQRPGVPIVSCKTPVAEGMNITTQGVKSSEYRQANTAMMFATHPNSCLSCSSNTKCQAQTVCATTLMGQKGLNNVMEKNESGSFDRSTAIYRDNDRCVNCDICVHTCKMQGVGALGFYNNEGHSVCSMGNLNSSECVQCGQCINRCPTGALMEMPEIAPVLEAIKDPKKNVVFQMAPAVRVAIAEEFGCKPGDKTLKNEIVTALKKLGPNVTVFDTDFSADLTIIEEGSELIERLYRTVTGKKLLGDDHMSTKLPMYTSCCPGWIMYAEKNYPEIMPNLSSCMSPQQMLGSLVKNYWAKNVKKIDPKTVVNVSIMPCSAKKQEKDKPNMVRDGMKIVDYVLTTRELGKMLRMSNIDPTKLPKTDFDKFMGDSTGAAVIFGATGGVMEAALRTAYELITGRPVPFKDLNIEAVRGFEGVREAAIKLENVLPKYKAFEGVTVKVAVAHGPGNARKVIEIVKQAELAGQPLPWHFIEIMACPGGCIGGGGQPKPTNLDIRKERAKLLYKEDMDLPKRKSHENLEVWDLYKQFLHEPLGHNSHHYLHTGYTANKVRNLEAYPATESAGLEDVLAKYPSKQEQYLLPIVIDECDKKGFISDASLIKIANHVGMYPSQVEAILTSYHYFPRKFTSNNHIYLCKCHNCMMKGQAKVIKAIQEKYGINCLHGGVAKNGKFTLHTLNWLGYCVNDAPSMMIKKTGTDYIEVLSGLNENSIESQIDRLINQQMPKYSEHKIEELSMKRNNPSLHSFMNDLVNLPSAVKKATSMDSSAIIKEIIDAGLVGRGGAGFKTGVKWQSARDAKSDEKFVVCNADEGLPSTYKDWCILRKPERRLEVLSGMGICAKTIGAKKCYLYLRYEYRNLVPDLEADIKKLKSTCPELSDLTYEVRLGGGPYVAGEENAQFESIMGHAPLPRKDRPLSVFPTVQGLFQKPTVINNVETFWSIPHIIEQGASSFSSNGLPKLLSVTGDINRPVLLESGLKGYSLNDLIAEIHAENITAAEVGGCTEPIIFQDKFSKRFGFGQGVLNAVGSCVLFNSQRDIADIYLNKLNFMAEESCKQCVPCRDGSAMFSEVYHQLLTGNKRVNLKSVLAAAESTGMTSICAHGKALQPLVTEAYNYIQQHPATKQH